MPSIEKVRKKRELNFQNSSSSQGRLTESEFEQLENVDQKNGKIAQNPIQLFVMIMAVAVPKSRKQNPVQQLAQFVVDPQVEQSIIVGGEQANCEPDQIVQIVAHRNVGGIVVHN